MKFKGERSTNKVDFESIPNAPKKLLSPSLEVVPDWYKEMPRFLDENLYPEDKTRGMMTMKHCIPFLDSLTLGYVYRLPQDIYIEQLEDGPSVRWGQEPPPAHNRPPGQTGKMPAPAGHHIEHLVWRTQVAVKWPEGYSVLMTHPLNRFDLPFTTITGVVDGPFAMHQGNIPFHVREGFEGVIPKGTPFIQCIPFLRENWKSTEENGVFLESEANTNNEDFNQGGWYRRRKWQKKTYK